MSTMEHLLMQIFDRKQWIEAQLAHQLESYGESLAYKVLAEGNQPPAWLWTTGHPKGLFLIPLPKVKTPLANNSTYFTKPDFLGNKVRQSSIFMETCASDKNIFAHDSYRELPSASKLHPETTTESEVLKACTKFVSSDRIQSLVVGQKNQGVRPCEQEKGTNHHGQEKEYIDRYIQPRLVPVTVDSSRDCLDMNNSQHRNGTDCGRITRSRSRSAAETRSGLSASLEPLDCGKASVEIQPEIQSVSSVNVSHLSCTTAGNVGANYTSSKRSEAVELDFDIEPQVNSGDAASFLPDTFPLVEPRKLFFGTIRDNTLNKYDCIFSEKKKQHSLANSFANLELEQPENDYCCDRGLEKVDFSEQDVLENRIAVDARILSDGSEQAEPQVLECEDSESNSQPKLGLQSSEDVNRKGSGYQTAVLDVSKKRSPTSGKKGQVEEDDREKLITESNSVLVQSTNIKQSGSLITSQKDKVLNSGNAVVGGVNSVLQSQLVPTSVGTHAMALDSHHHSRNSSCNRDQSVGSSLLNGCGLLSFDNDNVCLFPQPVDNGSTMGTKELIDGKASGIARNDRIEPKTANSSRISISLCQNLLSHLKNCSIPCSEENSMLPETNKDDISSCPEGAQEKPVSHNWVTPNSTETQGNPIKARYFLRSQSSREMNVVSSTISSWPKRRKANYRSSNILATSPRLRFGHSQCIKEGNDCSCKIDSGSKAEFQPTSISAEMKTRMSNATTKTPIHSMLDSKKEIIVENGSYLKAYSHPMTTMTSEHIQDEVLCDLAAGLSQNSESDETKFFEKTSCKLIKDYNLENCHNPLHETTKTFYNSEKFSKDRELSDTGMNPYTNGTCSSSHHDAGLVFCDDTMPEFEGFSIVSPSILEDDAIFKHSDLPTLTKERASMLEQLCKSRNVVTPRSCTSSRYKIHKVPDVYQSLSTGLFGGMNLSYHINDATMKQFGESDNDNLGSLFDISLVGRPYSYSMPSRRGVGHKAANPPSTPRVLKFGQKLASPSGQSGNGLEKLGSNPELICFRIDENSSIADENGHADDLDNNGEEISFRESKDLTNRKALLDVTGEYQNKQILVSQSTKLLDRNSLESVHSESYSRTHMSANSCLAKGYAVKRVSKTQDRENMDPALNKHVVRKAALSLRNRSTKKRTSGKINERSRSHGNLVTRCKPSNMVSNISSFVPLVHQRQQAVAPLKGRKEIKVKALEAAEAAKHVQEQKQNQREMRKAASKLEREKMEQENIRRLELMQNQKVEERKKKEANIAARKRQREEEGRKIKERKRRCTEETRRQKRGQGGKSHAGKVEEKLDNKTSGVIGQERELVEEVKEKLHSGKGAEVQWQGGTKIQIGINKDLTADNRNDTTIQEALELSLESNDLPKINVKSDGLQVVLQTRISIDEESQYLRSYEMSPYKDSDDEDEDEEIRREKKCIPSWARRECLEQIILSKQHLDPAKIFCRKRSFNFNEVLSTHVRQCPI